MITSMQGNRISIYRKLCLLNNQLIGWLIILIQFLVIEFSYSQTINIEQIKPLYRVAPVYGFKKGIVSLTFDDGYASQFGIGLRTLKRFHFPATFYVVSSFIDNAKALELKRDLPVEYEIGSHTSHHTHLTAIDNNDLLDEVSGSKYQLEHLFDRRVLTFAYPWGDYNPKVKNTVENFYMAARSANLGYNWLDNLDVYGLKVQAFNQGINNRTAESWVDFAINYRCWLIEMIHGIQGVGYKPLDSTEFVSHLEYINAKTSDLWVASVSDVIKYVNEAKRINVSCISCSDSLYQLVVDDGLEDSIYDQELSIELRIPENWQQVNVSGAELVDFKFSGGNNLARINVLPNAKPFTLKPNAFKQSIKPQNIKCVFNSENPFTDIISIAVYLPDLDDISVKLIATNGAVLTQNIQNNVTGEVEITLNTSMFPKGLYFLQIDSKKSGSLTSKLVKINLP